MRTIHLVNFKMHEDLKFEMNGDLIAFVGRNKSGKSSIIQAIEATYSMNKDAVSKPLTKGKKVGSVTREGIDINGNSIVIQWNIDESGSSFMALAVDENGIKRPISDPKKIRELVGTYFPMSVHDVFSQLKFAEGRKKFIKDYIMSFIPANSIKRIDEIDALITDSKARAFENNLFNKRTSQGSALQAAKTLQDNLALTPDDNIYIDTEEASKIEYEKITNLIEEVSVDTPYVVTALVESACLYLAKLRKDHFEFIEKENILTDVDDIYSVLNETIAPHLKELKDNLDKKRLEVDLEGLKERKKHADTYFSKLEKIKEKKTNWETQRDTVNKLSEEYNNLTKQIDDLRTERKKLIVQAKLPAGLSFNDDEIELNGFKFDETVVSETEAHIAVIELMLSISTADFINIGDWSLYDETSKKKVLEIANKRKCMVFGQLVTDDEVVDCKTIILE